MSVLHLFFSWPGGAVWPNVVAAILCDIPVLAFSTYKLHKQRERHHQERMAMLQPRAETVESELAPDIWQLDTAQIQ